VLFWVEQNHSHVGEGRPLGPSPHRRSARRANRRSCSRSNRRRRHRHLTLPAQGFGRRRGSGQRSSSTQRQTPTAAASPTRSSAGIPQTYRRSRSDRAPPNRTRSARRTPTTASRHHPHPR
jgi:hypothetical protein